ncbi:hypothetical protein Tco_0735561 [Tanacetum coccineum]
MDTGSSSKIDISLSLKERMTDQTESSNKNEESFSFRPHSEKTILKEKKIMCDIPIPQTFPAQQMVIMKELYNLSGTDYKYVDFSGVYPRINYLQGSSPQEKRIPWKLDMSSNSEIDYIPSDVDNLITQIGDIDINDKVVNIKMIKEENENANINDTASASTQIPVRNCKTTRGYAAVQSTIKKKEKYVPYEVMKNEPINPFGIYDCISSAEEAIDIWESL